MFLRSVIKSTVYDWLWLDELGEIELDSAVSHNETLSVCEFTNQF